MQQYINLAPQYFQSMNFYAVCWPINEIDLDWILLDPMGFLVIVSKLNI